MRNGSSVSSSRWPITRVSLTPAPSDVGWPRTVRATRREVDAATAFMANLRERWRKDALAYREGQAALRERRGAHRERSRSRRRYVASLTRPRLLPQAERRKA